MYDRSHAVWNRFAVGSDAWGNWGVGDAGNTPLPPWGLDCWMPIGHYVLGSVDVFDTPIASEGFGQIPILDFDASACSALANAGDGTFNGLSATIGGIEAPIGQLAAYGRSALMIHGGGSNAPDPLADYQGLWRTYGCQRLENLPWRTLANYLIPLQPGNIVVYTALETPADLGQ